MQLTRTSTVLLKSSAEMFTLTTHTRESGSETRIRRTDMRVIRWAHRPGPSEHSTSLEGRASFRDPGTRSSWFSRRLFLTDIGLSWGDKSVLYYTESVVSALYHWLIFTLTRYYQEYFLLGSVNNNESTSELKYFLEKMLSLRQIKLKLDSK